MFLKLLLTALVIVGALLTLKMRKQRSMQQLPVLNAPATGSFVRRPLIQLLAIGATLLMLGGATLYLYHQWREVYQVVTVKVIDTRSGQSISYQAYKGDIEGRIFVTTDGRTVALAEVERMEVGADPE